jgi:hypothetical protein
MRFCDFKARYMLRLVAAFAACVLVGATTASAQLFYEDFADSTLATGATQQSGTIAGGIITFNDTSATNRNRIVVTQNFTDPVMTFSYDSVAPVTHVNGFDNELTFRAGPIPATTPNTMSSTEFVIELIAYRTTGCATACTGGARAPFQNNGNESLFIVANNQANSLTFTSPIASEGSVTILGNQYISYVRDNATNAFALLKAATNYSTPTTGNGAGSKALERFGVGSSSNGHEGTMALDNVRVVSGVNFAGATPLVLGDVTGDGFVMMDDFDIIKNNFRQTPRSRAQGDLTGDGLVSLIDFTQWKGAFSGGGGSTAGMDMSFLSVPEPSSLVLFGLLSVMLAGCRGRRSAA